MESVCDNVNEYERLMALAEHLRDEKSVDKAIAECSAAVECALKKTCSEKKCELATYWHRFIGLRKN